jgi:hypothetical protein
MSFLGFRNAVSIGVSPHLTLGGSNLLGRLSPSLILQFAGAQTMDPRITFTRASTATYYGTQTALAEQNLLLQSQDFTTSWTTINSTVTANTEVAPDGTTTADTLAPTATTGFHGINQVNASTTGTTRTFSLFAKKGTTDFVQLYFNADSNVFANFNLNAGTVGTVGSASTATITSVGSGWYRCVMTTSSATANNVAVIAMITSDTAARAESWTALGTETILIWGAQVEQRSAVSNYTPTTTATVTNYIPVLETAAIDAPRFDYNPITQAALGLLIEEQRTNLRTYSEDFTNAVWTKSASSITADTVVAPDGTLTGDKLVENTATSRHFVTTTLTLTANTVYTLSVYMKAGERTTASFGNSSTANWVGGATIVVNLATGVITSGTGTIQSVGNGWYRVSITQTFGPANANGGMIIDLQTTAGYTGNGYSGIYIWGAQLEAGAFATSYIPTVASQVTRSADNASMTGTNFSSWFNAINGTLFAEYSAVVSGTRTMAAINDNTTNESIRLRTVGTNPFFTVTDGGVDQADIDAGTVASNIVYKFVGAYATNDFATSIAGGAAVTDTSGTLPTVDRMMIGNSAAANALNGHIRQIVYYPRRLTNSDLQAITD